MFRRNWSNQFTLGVLPMKWSMPRHAIVPPGRTQAWAVAIDSGPEMESITTWPPSPPVCSITASLISSSSRESTTRVAPRSVARSRRPAWWPRQTMRSAPFALAPCTPARPTAPSPITTTDWPGAVPADVSPCQPVDITSTSGSRVASLSGPASDSGIG